MVNQNPQPEFYTTRHAFTTADTNGSVKTVQIYTNQSFNAAIWLKHTLSIIEDIHNREKNPIIV